jgi:glutathione synthase/RimK-type ligase-like ATP-grasp enzyme
MINLVNLLEAFSIKESTIRAGPIVIKIYSNEGGYFVVLIKSKKVKRVVFCEDH